ncbi:MAG: hypothetical protein ISR57_01515 [Bacteroidales bacterium]|nr:hypothetical protein [Bacteroidota bacterium]MBL6949297.1 hypothetical protein [Bacteroidales bacterium]
MACKARFLGFILLTVICTSKLIAQDATMSEAALMARKAQDPLANISAIQSELSLRFNVGPNHGNTYAALVQPVYAISKKKINWIPRAIIPVVNTIPNIGKGQVWGMGDIIGQLFIAPKSKGTWKWGVGPQVSLKTRTADEFAGAGWGAGFGGVLVGGGGNWATAIIAGHLWGFGGDFSATSFQPMVFYNFPSMPGVSLSYQGMITYNWKGGSGNKLTFPLGLQFGKMFSLGRDWGLDLEAGAYGLAVRPSGTGNWELKTTIFLMIPN